MSRDDVRALQRSLNHFTHQYGLGLPALKVDGELGPKTNRRIMTAKFYLGYGRNRDASVKSLFVRRLRHAHSARYSTPRMLATGASRRRKRRQILARSGSQGGRGAARLALHYAGMHIVERPAGSNSGPYITSFEREWGFGPVAWCGCFAGHVARASGAKGLTSRVASVGAIESDAKAHRNGFSGWHSAHDGQLGDMVPLFGFGVHVETIVGRFAGGYITVGGNTSFEGSSGSQSNGGCVAKRYRSFAVVRGCARPNY